MTVWKLLKDYVHEFEIANECEFSDEAWQRIKQLERDIYAAMREEHPPQSLSDEAPRDNYWGLEL